jgi:mycofactocin precursor
MNEHTSDTDSAEHAEHLEPLEENFAMEGMEGEDVLVEEISIDGMCGVY